MRNTRYTPKRKNLKRRNYKSQLFIHDSNRAKHCSLYSNEANVTNSNSTSSLSLPRVFLCSHCSHFIHTNFTFTPIHISCIITVKDSSGKDADLSVYQGKVLLVVNVASKCGLTESNYTQLTELYRKYKDQGFVILAFPCNQFLYQEPGTSQEAHQFACTRFKADYPVFQKVRVNGQNAAPVYKFLKSKKPKFLGTRIKWNFTKFLVGKDGRVIDRYGPIVSPLSIQNDIEKALLA